MGISQHHLISQADISVLWRERITESSRINSRILKWRISRSNRENNANQPSFCSPFNAILYAACHSSIFYLLTVWDKIFQEPVFSFWGQKGAPRSYLPNSGSRYWSPRMSTCYILTFSCLANIAGCISWRLVSRVSHQKKTIALPSWWRCRSARRYNV